VNKCEYGRNVAQHTVNSGRQYHDKNKLTISIVNIVATITTIWYYQAAWSL